MKRLSLLGSTGSIGTQVLEIVRARPDDFQIVALTCGKNIPDLISQIREFKPKYVSVIDKEEAGRLADMFPDVLFGFGTSGLEQAAAFMPNEKDIVLVNALVGIAGLAPTVAAVRLGRTIALANKETLVAGGELVLELANQTGSVILPVDSEHSAIWQCLAGRKTEDIARIVITASGGAFRDRRQEDLEGVTVEEALAHPTWSMGKKITIDSATMMNKGFEIIEASWLFRIPIDRIETVIHKESIVHSLVEFRNRSFLAQLSTHDMRLPIQVALDYPEVRPTLAEPLDLAKVGTLHFDTLDENRFRAVRLAKEAFRLGGTAPVVLNAANEAAVQLFLQKKIRFVDIVPMIESALKNHVVRLHPDLETILAVDMETKRQLLNTIR